jgi:hypothetical protein
MVSLPERINIPEYTHLFDPDEKRYTEIEPVIVDAAFANVCAYNAEVNEVLAVTLPLIAAVILLYPDVTVPEAVASRRIDPAVDKVDMALNNTVIRVTPEGIEYSTNDPDVVGVSVNDVIVNP